MLRLAAWGVLECEVERELTSIVIGFNCAFGRVEGQPDPPRGLYHEVARHGSLVEVLRQGGLGERLFDPLDGGEVDYEGDEEIAALVVCGRFDESDPQHRALARQYFQRHRVITR